MRDYSLVHAYRFSWSAENVAVGLDHDSKMFPNKKWSAVVKAVGLPSIFYGFIAIALEIYIQVVVKRLCMAYSFTNCIPAGDLVSFTDNLFWLFFIWIDLAFI